MKSSLVMTEAGSPVRINLKTHDQNSPSNLAVKLYDESEVQTKKVSDVPN